MNFNRPATCTGAKDGVCPVRVPVISRNRSWWLASHLTVRQDKKAPDQVARLRVVMDAALGWLTERHTGITLYEGYIGAVIPPKVRDELAPEVRDVARLPCPFWTPDNCLLEDIPAPSPVIDVQPFGFLPRWIVQRFAPQALRALVLDRQIATAKILDLTRGTDLGPARETKQIILPNGATHGVDVPPG